MLMLYVRSNAHNKNTQPATNVLPITSIAFNVGFASERHRDAGNAGPSIVTAFGDYTGGQLR